MTVGENARTQSEHLCCLTRLGDGRAIFKGSPGSLSVFDSGDQGLTQLLEALDDRDVCYALLRVAVGRCLIAPLSLGIISPVLRV